MIMCGVAATALKATADVADTRAAYERCKNGPARHSSRRP
ncbi:hypothetical protein GA0115240_160732 [Streptomyces sp. DvalAA-14]|nr:hypothetical protein GA0115240_160732 [Streptomyces sp. DvalAA-14]